MRIIPITEVDIKIILPSLKQNKLSDYDEITSEILKFLHLPLITHQATFIITPYIQVVFLMKLKLQ